MIHTEFEKNGEKSSTWHHYISSRKLTAEELLYHARMEWTVETMHWMLDVHLGEDLCRIEDITIRKNLNMLRKTALNLIRSSGRDNIMDRSPFAFRDNSVFRR